MEYYFSYSRYYNDIAGVTNFDKEKNEFSAYRFYDDDPIIFQDGLKLTNRIGKKIDDKASWDPPRTLDTTYVWVYQWSN